MFLSFEKYDYILLRSITTIACENLYIVKQNKTWNEKIYMNGIQFLLVVAPKYDINFTIPITEPRYKIAWMKKLYAYVCVRKYIERKTTNPKT